MAMTMYATISDEVLVFLFSDPSYFQNTSAYTAPAIVQPAPSSDNSQPAPSSDDSQPAPSSSDNSQPAPTQGSDTNTGDVNYGGFATYFCRHSS